MAQFGRALRSGRRGRKFESCRLDDTGLLVKRSRRRPLTAETRVRFPDRSSIRDGVESELQATVAQSVEQLIRNQQVRGSSPLSSFFDG